MNLHRVTSLFVRVAHGGGASLSLHQLNAALQVAMEAWILVPRSQGAGLAHAS
jgi:hypothetical protein